MPLGRYNVGPCCGCGAPTPAGPCEGSPVSMLCMPARDLTLTYRAFFGGISTATLVFDGVNTWQTACLTVGGYFKFILTCAGLNARLYSQVNCGGSFTSCNEGAGMNTVAGTLSCDPFFREYDVNGGLCAGFGNLDWVKITE